MISTEQIRIVSSCQAAMMAAGWVSRCNMVFEDGDRYWQVQATRGKELVVCRAKVQAHAWAGALEQTWIIGAG